MSWQTFLLQINEGEAHWELAGLPHGVWLLLAVAVVGAAVLLIAALYRRERGLGPGARATLALLRVAALAVVVFILLNPRVVTEVRSTRPGRTLALFDVSTSMNERDRFGTEEAADLEAATGLEIAAERPSRMALVQAAFARHDVLERLGEKNRVSLHAFGAELTRLPALDEPRALFPAGTETRVGEALAGALREAGRDPVAGVVLVSDGRQNAGIHPLDLIADPVLWRPVPVHAVGVGLVEETRNFTVTDLSAPDTVEVGYPVEIEGVVRLSGIRGAAVATLYRFRRGGRGLEKVEERTLESTGPRIETRLRFIDTLSEKGTYHYRLQIATHAEETTTRDNRREIMVLAAEEKRRVLLLARAMTLYTFLARFFERDDGIQVSCWLADADAQYLHDGDITIRKPPATAKELESYDLVVLLDPGPETLTPGFQEALREFVTEQGGGVAYVAGDTNTPKLARDPGMRRFLALLPVALSSSAPLLGSGQYHTEAWRPELTENGAIHPLCRLENDADSNRRLFSVLAPLYFVHPTSSLRPSGVDLLRGPRDAIVAAVHQAGPGEVVYLGTSEFDLWRASGENLHQRFWAGVVRYLALGKRRLGASKVTVETDRDRYTAGDQVRIMVQLSGGEKERAAARLDLFVEAESEAGADADAPAGGAAPESASAGPRRQRVALYPEATPGATPGSSPERYAGLVRTHHAGRYRVLLGTEEKTSFEVAPVSTEWQDPTPDFHLLEELAAATGGSFMRLSEIDRLPERIPDGSVTEVIGRRTTALWDSALLMVLFAALLTVEWALRKWWHLN